MPTEVDAVGKRVHGNWCSDTRSFTPDEGIEPRVQEDPREQEDLAGNTLGVDTMPSDSTVTQFATHLLAENKLRRWRDVRTPRPKPKLDNSTTVRRLKERERVRMKRRLEEKMIEEEESADST